MMDMLTMVPPNAKVVVAFGCADSSVSARFQQINPRCRYIGIMPNETRTMQDLGLSKGSIDCMVYHKSFIGNEEFLARWAKDIGYLKEDGQIILDIPNALYIRNILNHVKDNAAEKCSLSLDAFKALCLAHHLTMYDVRPYGSKADETLKKDGDLFTALVVLLNRCGLEEKKELLWVKGFVVRAAKKEVRHVLLQTLLGEVKVCSRVRIVEPHSFCATIPGVKIINDIGTSDLSVGDLYKHKVFIQQRVWQKPADIKTLIMHGYLVISEIDDAPERWPYHVDNRYFAFRACHGVQVSTRALAEHMRRFNPNVAVFENQIIALPKLKDFHHLDKITLFFGALNRRDDWQEFMPVLNEILLRYRNKVSVKVIHDQEFFDQIDIEDKEFIPFCPYEMYSHVLRNSDIALLPLKDNHFNRMKSDLKFIEAASHGVAVLASPCVYGDYIQHGKTGLIYHHMGEFKAYLELLLDNHELRHEIAKNAYQYVESSRLLAYHYDQRYQWYSELLRKMPELNQALIARSPELS